MKFKHIVIIVPMVMLTSMSVSGATTYRPGHGEDLESDRSKGLYVLRAVSIPVERHGLKSFVTAIVKCYPDGKCNIVCAYAGKSSLKCCSEEGAVLYEGADRYATGIRPEDVGDEANPPDEVYRWIDASAQFSACKDEQHGAWIIPCRAVERVLFTEPTVRMCRSQCSKQIGSEDQQPKAKLAGRLCTAEQTGKRKSEGSITYQIELDASVNCVLPDDLPVYRMRNTYEARCEYLKKRGETTEVDKVPFTIGNLMNNNLTFECCEMSPDRIIVMKGKVTWRFRIFNDEFGEGSTDDYKEFEDRYNEPLIESVKQQFGN